MFPDDPFVMDGKTTFTDALLVQCISDPARLSIAGGKGGRGGFFVETESEAPLIPGFHRATLRTREGREVSGFGGHELAFYPVAHRFRWEAGDPEARRSLKDYQPGARGHLQILGVLPNGIWVVVTARGLASRDLLRAFKAHRRRVARSLRAADGRPYGPFAALLRLASGQPYRKGSSVVTPFMAVTGELERAPTEIGRAVRARWEEVQAWVMAWAGDGDGDDNGNGREEISSLPEAPAPRTEIPEPGPAPAPAPAQEPEEPEEEPAEEPEPAPSGPDLDVQAALAFLIGKAGDIALDRLAGALGSRPKDAGEAVRALASQKGDASFWREVSGALDRFLAWTERIPSLRQVAPARYRALKERVRIGLAFGVDRDDPETLAALAALAWLFRPGERQALEALFRRDPDVEPAFGGQKPAGARSFAP